MIKRLSLRGKVTLGYIAVFALTVVLGSSGIYFATQQVLTNSMDSSLREMASIARGSVERVQGQLRFAPELRPTREVTIELLSASGQVLASSGKDMEPSTQTLPIQAGLTTQNQRRVLTTSLPEHLFLRVSRPTEILSEFLETLARLLVMAGSLMIAASCAAGYWLANRALKPVDAVARTAQNIAERGDYAQRVPQTAGQDEMARLTQTVNLMLDRLAGTIEREKQFARVAAHELRTPLTVLKGRLDLTLDRPRSAEEYKKALMGMQNRVEALNGLSETLLELARTETTAELEKVDLTTAALRVTEELEDHAIQRGKRFRLNLHESWVQAERAGVERLISNLLENALKYGEGPDVTVKIVGTVLSVENGGDGPLPAEWERLLQPFERGKNVQSVSGSGLGLALVAALARRWHAQILPEWQPGTFTVRVMFRKPLHQGREVP